MSTEVELSQRRLERELEFQKRAVARLEARVDFLEEIILIDDPNHLSGVQLRQLGKAGERLLEVGYRLDNVVDLYYGLSSAVRSPQLSRELAGAIIGEVLGGHLFGTVLGRGSAEKEGLYLRARNNIHRTPRERWPEFGMHPIFPS